MEKLSTYFQTGQGQLSPVSPQTKQQRIHKQVSRSSNAVDCAMIIAYLNHLSYARTERSILIMQGQIDSSAPKAVTPQSWPPRLSSTGQLSPLPGPSRLRP